MSMKRVISFVVLGLLMAIVVLFGLLRWLSLYEGNSTKKIVASCQFTSVGGYLNSEIKARGNLFDEQRWFDAIDLNKASCGYSLVVVNSRVFDYTGAEIVLKVSEEGGRYLQRVKAGHKEFVSLSQDFDRYEIE